MLLKYVLAWFGMMVLADELVGPLRSRGREVIRASIDGCHHPRSVRHRQGRYSPRGYYDDSFDVDAVLSCLLSPLGPGGDRKYRIAQFDYRTDRPVECPWLQARPDAVLVVEGIFLHRPELARHWDFTVFVDAGFETTIGRALVRDRCLFATEEEMRQAYERRYIPGQKTYLSDHRPAKKADVVLQNDDVQNPELVVNGLTRPARRAATAHRANL